MRVVVWLGLISWACSESASTGPGKVSRCWVLSHQAHQAMAISAGRPAEWCIHLGC